MESTSEKEREAWEEFTDKLIKHIVHGEPLKMTIDEESKFMLYETKEDADGID